MNEFICMSCLRTWFYGPDAFLTSGYFIHTCVYILAVLMLCAHEERSCKSAHEMPSTSESDSFGESYNARHFVTHCPNLMYGARTLLTKPTLLFSSKPKSQSHNWKIGNRKNLLASRPSTNKICQINTNRIEKSSGASI